MDLPSAPSHAEVAHRVARNAEARHPREQLLADEDQRAREYLPTLAPGGDVE